MKLGRYLGAAAVALAFGIEPCLGALGVGDRAPEIKVGSWLQGDAVTAFEGDKVYLVEFWATWCGPCKASIPHLNELHQRYEDRGLVVIGQNVFEKDDSLVEPFVKKMADQMTYRVSADDKSAGSRGFMAEHWLAAAGKSGIPCAFLVNKSGKITFIGHPMTIKDADLETLLAEPSVGSAAVGGALEEVTATEPSAEAQALAARAEAEIRAGDLAKAEITISELQETVDEKFRDIGGLLNLDLLLARKQYQDAVFLAELLADDFRDNPSVRIAVATRLVGQSGADAALLKAAEGIATPVSGTAGASQSGALAVLARIACLRGDYPTGVGLQTKAVAVAPEGERSAQQAVLEAYQEGRVPGAKVSSEKAR